MRPTLRQLQYVVAIAETGRFHEAAKRLYVSQPSLSAQVADVEAQLDVKLIERGRHGAIMTPQGEEFVKRARIILRSVEDLKSAMEAGATSLAGRIRLGVLPSVGPYLLPSVVKTLHRDNPGLRLNVQEHRTLDLRTGLSDGSLDCVISATEDHPDTGGARLFEERLWICAAADDPLAGDGPVAIDDLKGRDLLTVGSGHRFSLIVQQLADRMGAFISTEYQGTSLDAVRQMAATGAGVAILPALYALSEAKRDDDLVLRPIDHPLARRSVSLIWRSASPLADRFEQIADVMRDAADALLVGDKS
jgi:LysR family hydrogen peroxide-inducible transcriptional activator